MFRSYYNVLCTYDFIHVIGKHLRNYDVSNVKNAL